MKRWAVIQVNVGILGQGYMPLGAIVDATT